MVPNWLINRWMVPYGPIARELVTNPPQSCRHRDHRNDDGSEYRIELNAAHGESLLITCCAVRCRITLAVNQPQAINGQSRLAVGLVNP
jgi:hypothetical protein